MRSTHSNRLWVTSPDDFERLLCHPSSVAGEFDISERRGWVQFTSLKALDTARREIGLKRHRRRCAWCGKDMGPAALTATGRSNGICGTCKSNVFRN